MGQKSAFTQGKAFANDAGAADRKTANDFRGHFLIAMPSLRDPMFSHTITFVCDHNASGALGIVINHPLELKLGEIFAQLELPREGRQAKQTVLAGGPVQIDRGFVLHPAGREWESTLQISDDVSLTASRDIIADMANDRGPDKALVALGYAGWEAGQLEEEIASNSWLTIPAQKHILFDTPVEQRWAAASQYLGIDLNLIHSTAGHA